MSSRDPQHESDAVIKLRKKLDELKAAHAMVAGAAAKFEIKEQIGDTEKSLREILRTGVQSDEFGLDKIDEELVQQFFEQCAKYESEYQKHADGDFEARERFLIRHALAYHSSDGAAALTDDGIILCGRADAIPASRVHTRTEIIVADQSQFLDGSLLYLRREILQRLAFLWRTATSSPNIRDDEGNEVAFYDVPEIAVIEAVTNSLIHRDYIEDDKAYIKVADDRIEIVNPGKSKTPLDDLLGHASYDLRPKYERNPRIIEVTTLARLNNARGSGISRIRQALERNGTVRGDGQLGLELRNDEAKNRFHLVIYRRDISRLVPKFTRKIARTQLDKHAPRVLFGRETELAALDAAWAKGTLNVYTLVAWGGAGKTSLVFHWVQTRFAAKGWPGVERYFDWSFYSQGTGESRQTSADLFITKALAFFGDPDPTVGGPHERGERLAGLIRRHRTLLILDGIEPLQYPPNDPQAGRLKDPALESLLRELAADNPGLVVITTREHLTNVEGHTTTKEQKLDKLPKEAAVALLRDLQIAGTDEELHAAWEYAGGHALTLSLLGRFIADAYEDRDIRHYREVTFEAADQEHQGRSAFKVMVAYERWLRSGGPERQRELAVLRLTGLFDRPMAKRYLQALRAKPAIPGLTDALVTLTEQQWNIAVTRLSRMGLLSVSADAIDAHPLIRDYFAAQLKRDQPAAFRAAHSRLFDYLCENTPYRPDGIDGLAPLYEAVTHGCLAGRHQEACDMVYVDRILRGTESDGFYSTNKLGAIGADLSAVAAFFDAPWRQVSPNLTASDQAWLLNQTATSLRALGRLTEALQPMRAGLEIAVSLKDWKNAARYASNLSELEVTQGRLPDGVTDARQSITHADQSGDAFQRMGNRTTAADALHQSGQRAEAGTLFAEAERLQQDMQPQFNLLYSLRGFHYCDWLLAPAEQAAWQQLLHQPLSNSESQISDGLAEVEGRATTTLGWGKQIGALLNIALDHMILARVGLTRAILANPLPQPTLDLPHVATAVNGLRAAGHMDELPRGLLTASLYRFVRGEHDLALKHLAEAQQIAERGPMPLYLADIHLTRARLAGSLREEGGGMNVDAKAELSQAAQLIRTLGYGRRYEELADAEAALRTNRPRT
jgi:hypothetical protein